jgi:hypothetical protein
VTVRPTPFDINNYAHAFTNRRVFTAFQRDSALPGLHTLADKTTVERKVFLKERQLWCLNRGSRGKAI